MVYCGKPSKACLECRVNRRKCDLSKPSCSQCLRTGSVCRGYRDQVELAFRDQSMHVVRRAQHSHQVSKGTTSSKSKTWPANSKRSPQTVAVTVTKGIENYIDQLLHSRIITPIEVQATPFFLHHYLLSETVSPIDDIDCLAAIYGHASEDYLASIINAVGIASLSNLRREPHLMNDAGHKYTLALRGIRAGLKKPTESRSDQMLISLMLLTVYETVTSINMEKENPCESHTHAALKLLELRGEGQLNFKIGRRLFLQLRNEVLLSCLQKNYPIPEVILEMMSENQKFETEEESLYSHLANIAVKICALGDTTKSHLPLAVASNEKISQHIAQALSIEADLVNWSTHVSSSYDFSTFAATKPEDFYLGLYQKYSSLSIAHTWNLYRCARISLHRILIRLRPLYLQGTSIVPMTPLNEYSVRSSEAVIHECAFDICLTVPFILGSCQTEQNSLSNSRAACGLSLLRPLYIVGIACPAEQSMRQWARLQLQKIEAMTGIKTARIITLMLSE